jgi:SAM-dependent methyltransferase
MVYGLSEYWYSWTGNPEDIGRDFIHNLGVPSNKQILPPKLFTRFFLAQDAAIPGPTDILVRREALDREGGFEEIFRGAYEDEVFYAKVCLHEPIVAVNTCWDRYRQHPNSSNSIVQKSRQEYSTRRFFLNWLSGYLKEQSFKDAEILQALRKEIWRCRHPNMSQLRKDGQDLMLRIVRRMLPLPFRSWIWAKLKGTTQCPPVGWVRLGDMRRLTPISRTFGYDRGMPIDRYYIEKFLADYQQDIKGHVLEIQDATYTRKFGGNRVLKSDVLHIEPGNPGITIVADLTCADQIPSNSFDCIILTQTLQFIYGVRPALHTLFRILNPGGVLLATIPGLCSISRYDMERWGHYWGFTTLSARRLFEEVFPTEYVKINAFGNVFSAAAFLYGMATEELRRSEIEFFDPDYEVIIAIRAVKPEL